MSGPASFLETFLAAPAPALTSQICFPPMNSSTAGPDCGGDLVVSLVPASAICEAIRQKRGAWSRKDAVKRKCRTTFAASLWTERSSQPRPTPKAFSLEAFRIYREAVIGLSPGRLRRLQRARLAFEDAHTAAFGRDVGLAESGWRLGGTLGTGNKKRIALKERQNFGNPV